MQHMVNWSAISHSIPSVGQLSESIAYAEDHLCSRQAIDTASGFDNPILHRRCLEYFSLAIIKAWFIIYKLDCHLDDYFA